MPWQPSGSRKILQQRRYVERLSSLLLRARTASLRSDEAERIERFLATPPKALAVLPLQFRFADPIRKTWLEVTKQYNLEAADMKRPSGTGNGTGFALLSRTQKKGQISNFCKRNAAHEECRSPVLVGWNNAQPRWLISIRT
jgi:hypothetical protein